VEADMPDPAVDDRVRNALPPTRRNRRRLELATGVVLTALVGALLAAAPASAATDVDYVTRHFAGTGGQSCSPGSTPGPTPRPATGSEFCNITSTAVHANGDVYMVDLGSRLIYRVSDGELSVVAGGGGTRGASTPALRATFEGPWGAVVVGDDLYFTDPEDPAVYTMDVTTGALTRIAGTGSFSGNPSSLPSFGGLAASTPLGYPVDIAVDPASRDVYLADANGAVEKIDGTTGILSLVAGDPGSSTVPTTSPTPAATTAIGPLETLALGPDGTLYIGNRPPGGSSLTSAIYQVTPDGSIRLFAGNGQDAPSVDGPALDSPLQRLKRLRTSPNGHLYAALNTQVVAIDPRGSLEVIAGTGAPVPDSVAFDVASTTSGMHRAMGLSFGPDCSLYVNTGMHHYIARLEPQQPCALAAPTAVAGDASATVT
jgi:hypothetical protein